MENLGVFLKQLASFLWGDCLLYTLLAVGGFIFICNRVYSV